MRELDKQSVLGMGRGDWRSGKDEIVAVLRRRIWVTCVCLFRIEAFSLMGEKATAPLSSTLAWKIPWTEERGRLQSMVSQRVRHDFTFTFYITKYKEHRIGMKTDLFQSCGHC